MTRKSFAAVAVGAALLLGGCGAGTTPAPPPVSRAQPVGPETAAVAELPKSDPVSLDIPSIGAHSSLVPLGLNPDDTVQVPPVSTPLQAGWYEFGPTPGETGPAVVLGHVDGNKHKGIFYRLKEVKPGDEVAIARRDGRTAHFEVTKVDEVPKDVFPSDAVYGDTAGPELRLITCGGGFDHAAHNYVDNIIVYAGLVPEGR
ncbi:class F sortase [Amycolatopsis sp. PS_44_ISF1]|uniref:class F sortase n=1 Tax=Amycolatopsis sp. PS_44_ISF1 TaxID=2974917 RepID=UPI0028DDBC50|nr:class F sortase [Amycolatopsis sp. PS_44_ISF1]MDT8909525.1 class F sortase [Amycolatopsis sp. PS_44_ISF1]